MFSSPLHTQTKASHPLSPQFYLTHHVEKHFIFIIKWDIDPFFLLNEQGIRKQDEAHSVNFALPICHTQNPILRLIHAALATSWPVVTVLNQIRTNQRRTFFVVCHHFPQLLEKVLREGTRRLPVYLKMRFFRNGGCRDITIWAKMFRVSLCQVTVAVLFMVGAATILYSEHLWLQGRSLDRPESQTDTVQFSVIPPPTACDCKDKVSKAVKEVAAAKQAILKNNFKDSNSYPTNKKQIIVLSYGRSGSSFTSDIVIQDPRTFFAFEPLYKVMIRYTGSDQIHDIGVLGNDKFAPKPNEKGELVSPEPYAMVGAPTYANYSVEATQILRYFLTCQFEYLKADDLLNFMFLNRNNTIEFYKCFRDFPQEQAYFPKYLGCLWKLKEVCMSKEFQVVKVIRYPARILRPLLEEFPNLKILYLVRDPRGTLSSEMEILKTYAKTSIKEAAETFCGMVNDDAENIRLLSESYPDRIRTIRYETIARDAVDAAKRMYNFLELSFTPKIETYIRHITAAKKDGHNFSTLRKDSWLAANKWRTIASYKNVRSVDTACGDVYDAVGFVKVPRESYLRDLNTSLASQASQMENI